MLWLTKAKGEKYMACLSRWRHRLWFYHRTSGWVNFLERMRVFGQDNLHYTGAESLTLADGQVAARANWRLLPCDGSQQSKDENNDECSGSPPDSTGT